jgi:hypothetical protein
VNVARVTVRNQKSRWSSCSRRGTISLNWRLIQTPGFVRDYIILHELAHRRQMNHSATFLAGGGNRLSEIRNRRKMVETILHKLDRYPLTFKNQKTNIPMAAPNMSKVTNTIRIKDNFEGICFRMIFLSELTSKMPINKNGASKPLMMAVQ